ncbi:MAG: hypothetical protein ABSG72_19525 [Candidatus Sulfotelmatobacter sp.]|jgi:hypothetical protein
MTTDEQERMQSLCEQIVKEENGAKFTKLVEELNDLLDPNEQPARVREPASKPECRRLPEWSNE